MKTCIICKTTKELDQYHKDKSRKDGHSPKCKVCVKAWQQANKDKMNANAKAWREANPEKAREVSKNYHERNPDAKERMNRAYRRAHPGRVIAGNAIARARKRMALPSWVDDVEKAIMESVYSVATQMKLASGVRYEVDHIIPLKNDAVQGLHTADNLRIVTSKENKAKGNKIWDDMWS